MIAEVAPEGLRHAARLQDASYGELLAALHRIEGDFAADGDVVARRELPGQHQRIRLRQEDQRIVDYVLVGIVEIVVAQAAVAGHIDRQDEQFALSGEAGIGFGLR